MPTVTRSDASIVTETVSVALRLAVSAVGAIGNFYQARIQTGNVTPTGSSTLGSYIAANVQDWQNAQYRWQSNTVTTDQWIKLDLGASPPSYYGVYLGRLNVGVGTVQANATDTWGAPTFSEVNSFTRDDHISRRNKIVFFNAFHTEVTYRFVRFLINSATVTDDGATFKVGKFFPLVTSVEIEPRQEVSIQRMKAVLEQEFSSGRHEILSQGEQKMILDFPWEYMWNPTRSPDGNEESSMLSLATDKDVPVIVCPNTLRTYQAYLCRQMGELAIRSSQGIGAQMPLSFIEIT